MSTKAALKAAKTALDNGDYDKAIEQAQAVLATDSQSHFAKLFLGRAYEKQGKFDDAANTYNSAAKLKPDDNQAWQGLCSVYEQQGRKKVDEYREAIVKCAEHLVVADDKHRCQTYIDKLIAFTKKHGTQEQYKRALGVLLPGSSIYDFLEGRIQQPVVTYMRLAEITEQEESETISKEINERRTRIGARLGQVTLDVKREVYAKSELESFYQHIIDWCSDDELRRQYEEKLLERANDTLNILPLEQKPPKLEQVLKLANGMVIIHHPFQLAWDLVLESRDPDDLRDLDVGILREYVTLFPEGGLSRVLNGWLNSELSPFPPLPKTDDEEPAEELSPADRLLLFTEGLPDAESSPFAHRTTADYYLHLEENQTAGETARAGIKALATQSASFGIKLQNTLDALNSVLATSLVHHQAPRNHPEAKRLFEDILQRKPKSTQGLVGLGLIFEETEDFEEAIDFFTRALAEDTGNVRVGTELAWCRALGGDYLQAKAELEDFLQQMKENDPRSRDLRAQTFHRIGICMWNIDTSKSARKDRNGAYSYFLAAIKTNANYAPAYTSLGKYFADYAKDKKRARQCFQKAFELSPAEVEAAERLAKSFADQSDWEIVEIVAQRVVESGRTRPPPGSKRKGISWPYSALGIVQMNKQEYQKAIVSFLAALRIQPEDYQSYIGLGESYHNSGRYNSALRTFHYALEPHDGVELRITGEQWFARYMLANVHRELGDHDEAISGLNEVLKERPSEFGVLMSLLQTHVEKSWRCVEAGYFGQAVESAIAAIDTAIVIVKTRPEAFNLWKAVGDACSVFSYVQSGIERYPSEEVKQLLDSSSSEDMYELLANVDHVSQGSLEQINNSSVTKTPEPIITGILAYKRAIDACSNDVHAQAVAWYNLGLAEQRANVCSDTKSGKKFLVAAIRCFKRAIELEAGNSDFWNALGVAFSTVRPELAQHSFVRSLHINELNAKVWANLGVLYLIQNDIELAHQAFGRSQSTDPDYAHAWLGEGIIALLSGDVKEALNHFTHAFEISDSTSIITKRQYAVSSFDHLLSSPHVSSDLTKLIQPIFSLEQLQRQAPHDISYRHLAALFLERVGDHTAATEALTSLSSIAEAEYETSESESSLARFAHAKCDISRNQLSSRDFSSAVENAETALDLTSDAEGCGLDAEARRKLRLSAHLTAGLAHFNLGDLQSSISMFRAALVESGNDPDVVCSLVRVLWTQGGKQEKAVARDQLFECVEAHPEQVEAVTLLGVIAALEDDEDTSSAVKEDLISLRVKDGITTSDKTGIDLLLASLAALHVADTDGDDWKESQAVIMLDPSSSRAWSELATLSGSEGAAAMALRAAAKTVPPLGDAGAEDLSNAFAGMGSVGDAQRAIMLAPWNVSGWESMGEALSA